MKRNALISTIDVVAFVCFVLLASFWVAVVFFAVLAVHLFLHWPFIVSLFKGRLRGQRSRLRPALALLALAAAPLLSPVQQIDAEPGYYGQGRQGAGGRQGR